MKKIKIAAYAKINLSLDITGLREDGYHLIETVMQSISLHDTVTIEKNSRSGEIKLFCNLPYVPCDERNVAYKAAKLFFEMTGIDDCGVFINLRKKIPVGAGLAGGSCDAAAVIMGLSHLFEVTLSEEQIAELTLSCGADVHFCYYGGTAIATGIGEELERIRGREDYNIVIAKPRKPISTKNLYNLFDNEEKSVQVNTKEVIDALAENDLAKLSENLRNVLQSAANKICPQIEEYLTALKQSGAVGASMSGSGSAVFAIFDSKEKAAKAAETLKALFQEAFIYNATPVSEGLKIID